MSKLTIEILEEKITKMRKDVESYERMIGYNAVMNEKGKQEVRAIITDINQKINDIQNELAQLRLKQDSTPLQKVLETISLDEDDSKILEDYFNKNGFKIKLSLTPEEVWKRYNIV